MLSAGQETIDTAQGPIRVGVNRSNGLDPNTTDEITQYMLNNHGLYWRDFKIGNVRKWNEELAAWFDTAENPFVPEIAVVEMEDDFTPDVIVTAEVAEMDQDPDPTPINLYAHAASSKKRRRTTTDEEIGLRHRLLDERRGGVTSPTASSKHGFSLTHC
jgi:hypothetical protein